MRTILLSLVAAAAVATPALANEARVEIRAGEIWGSGSSEAIAGAAVGYDFDLGSKAFAGVEVSGDKILDSATNRVAFGFSGRLGMKLSPDDKVFAAAGYTTKPCSGCVDSENLGAGVEHNFGPLYGKIEYRHFFTNGGLPDTDAIVGGIGVNF
jgi:outer membrane immunogenic protein